MNPLYALMDRIEDNQLSKEDARALVRILFVLTPETDVPEADQAAHYRVARRYLNEVTR